MYLLQIVCSNGNSSNWFFRNDEEAFKEYLYLCQTGSSNWERALQVQLYDAEKDLCGVTRKKDLLSIYNFCSECNKSLSNQRMMQLIERKLYLVMKETI